MARARRMERAIERTDPFSLNDPNERHSPKP